MFCQRLTVHLFYIHYGKMKQRSATNIIGIVIIAGGISLILRGNSVTFSSLFTSWWVYVILGYAIYDMIKKKINIFNIAMALFAVSYIGRNAGWIPHLFKGSYIIAAFIILFGINIMVKRDEQNNGRKREHMRQNENPSYVSIFGDREILVDEKIIDGTHLFAIFGDITLDASHATCEEDTIIEVTSIFSDVDLFISDNIRVVLKGNPILGDIKDRRRVTSRLHDGPLLTVRVLCLFGDVIIR